MSQLTLSHVHFNILSDVIVHDFNLELRLGEVKTLFGPSGCGKTSVLRLIAGLATPSKGEIHNCFKKVGFLFQENRLIPHLNTAQNLQIFMEEPNWKRILSLAEQVGLSDSDLNKYPRELSGGMARRVAFLRLLLSDSDLVLLDEPFVGLDRDLRDILVHLLQEKIVAQQLACLLVTHDRFEAARLSHEILLLSAKGMTVKQHIQLSEPLLSRDTQYETKVVNSQLQNMVFYD